jgi:hypothetical protein
MALIPAVRCAPRPAGIVANRGKHQEREEWAMATFTSEQTGPDYISSMPASEAIRTIEAYAGTPRQELGIATEHPLSLYPGGVDNKSLSRIAGTSIPEFKSLSVDPDDPGDGRMRDLTRKGFRTVHLPGGAWQMPRRIYYLDPLRRLAYVVPISEEGVIDPDFLREFYSCFTARSGHQESLLALWNLCKLDNGQTSSFDQLYQEVMHRRKIFRELARATLFVFLGLGTAGGQTSISISRFSPSSPLILMDGGVFEPENLGHQVADLESLWFSKAHQVASRILAQRIVSQDPSQWAGEFAPIWVGSQHLTRENWRQIPSAISRIETALKQSGGRLDRIIVLDGVDVTTSDSLQVKSNLEHQWIPSLRAYAPNVWHIRPLDLGFSALAFNTRKAGVEYAKPVYPDPKDPSDMNPAYMLSSFLTEEFLTPECVIYLESARRAGMVFKGVWQTEWDAFLSAQLLALTTLRIWATADAADCVPEFQYLDTTGCFYDRKSQIFQILSQATRNTISIYGNDPRL